MRGEGLTPGQALQDAWRDELLKDKRKRTAKSNRASALGHPCLRYLVLLRITQPKFMPDFDLPSLARMREGNLHERDVKAKLLDAGYEVEESQREFTMPEYDISGHVDGFVRFGCKTSTMNATVGGKDGAPIRVISSTGKFTLRCAFECKSCSTFLWQGITDYESLKADHASRWLKRYPTQLQLYMLMANEDQGLFCFKNRDSGQPKFMDVPQDLEVAESAIQKAEGVNKHMKAGTLPEFHPDPDECFNCDLHLSCNPPCVQQAGPGVEIFADEVLTQLLKRKAELAAAKKEAKAVDESLKRMVEGKRGIAGAWFIDGKWVDRKGYEVKPTRYWKAAYKHVESLKEGVT